jgi:hypothetical protein
MPLYHRVYTPDLLAHSEAVRFGCQIVTC